MFWENQLLYHKSPRSFRMKKVLDCIFILIIVLILMSCVTTAKAISEQSRIIDNTDILSEQQKDNIQSELSSLENFSLVIVINDVGNRCTEDYAYSLAKLIQQDLFSSEEESLIITYCNSLEGYQLGIYYNGKKNIDTKQLKKLIQSEFELYLTDASWIEGSSISCIKKIAKTIQPVITPFPESTSQSNSVPHQTSFWEVYGKYRMILSIIFSVFIAGIVTAIVVYHKHRKQIDKSIESWLNNKED